MDYYPITPEQEQELYEVAQQMFRRRPEITIEQVTFRLSALVFESGRLSDTVSVEKRREVATKAKEETYS